MCIINMIMEKIFLKCHGEKQYIIQLIYLLLKLEICLFLLSWHQKDWSVKNNFELSWNIIKVISGFYHNAVLLHTKSQFHQTKLYHTMLTLGKHITPRIMLIKTGKKVDICMLFFIWVYCLCPRDGTNLNAGLVSQQRKVLANKTVLF